MKTNLLAAFALATASVAFVGCQKNDPAPQNPTAAVTASNDAVTAANATVVDGPNGSITINYTLDQAPANNSVVVELTSVPQSGNPGQSSSYSGVRSQTRTAAGTYSETFAGRVITIRNRSFVVGGPPAGTYTAKIYFGSNTPENLQFTIPNIVKQ